MTPKRYTKRRERIEKLLLVFAFIFALTFILVLLIQGVYYIVADLAKLEQQRNYLIKSL